MKQDFSIDTFTLRNVSALAQFAKQEYPEGEIVNEKFLLWEYFQNPFGDAMITVASDEKEKISAQYTLIPLQFVVEGKTIEGSLSLNTLTEAKFRGQGLFKRTAERTYKRCSESGIHFTIGVPNKNSFGGFLNRLDFTHAGNLSFMVKPLRPFAIAKSLFGRSEEKKGKEIELSIEEITLREKSISILDPENDKILYLNFWNQWKSQNKISVYRSAEYLVWRYLKNPLRRYHLLKWVENGEMKAFAVVRAMHVYGLRACVLMEFSCFKEFQAKAFLNAIRFEMKRNGLDIITSVSAAKNYENHQLRKAGFISVPKFLLPQQLPFIVRAHKSFENSELLMSLNNWHFTFGDYDIF